MLASVALLGATALFDITSGTGEVTDEITTAGPILLGVVGLMVALRVSIKLLKRAGR